MLLIILYYIVVCRINKSKRNQRLARKLKDKTRKKIKNRDRFRVREERKNEERQKEDIER